METRTDVKSAYPRATEQASRVVAGIRPDQLASQTPCAKWNVRELLNHFIGSNLMMAAVGSGRSVGEGTSGTEAIDAMGDLVGDDPVAAYASSSASATQAFNAPGALERTWKLPFAELPGSVALNIHFIETVAHAWDLAKCTGQLDGLDPELAEAGLATAHGLVQPEFRNAEGHPFGPEVSVPAGAPAYERLAGFLGRTP